MPTPRTLAPAALLLAVALTAAGCSGGPGGQAGDAGATGGTAAGGGKLRAVKVMLDWTPNTNHTGLYAAKAKGFFAAHGLDVAIAQPGDADPGTLVAAGKVPFGVGFQETVTEARDQGAPLVSVAAVVQHNTSGFASPVDRNLKRPRDYAGHTYGAYGDPIEESVLGAVVKADGGDPSRIKSVKIGDVDFLAATEKGVDFAWIYYGWEGIGAKQKGEPLNIQYLRDYDKRLDFYTPVLTTSEQLIAKDPQLVRDFVAGASEGYTWAAQHPDEAGDVLAEAAPDLDPALVRESQAWLSPKYVDDAPAWGVQKASVWTGFSDWLVERKLIKKPVDAGKAFTNDFLPKPSGS